MPRTTSEYILAALITIAAGTYLWVLADMRLAQMEATYGTPTATTIVTEVPR